MVGEAMDQRTVSRDKVEALFKQIQQRAFQVELDPLSITQVREVIQINSPKKAKGCEALGIDDLRRLPDEGIQQLIDFCHEVERCVSWPWQLMTVFATLSPDVY